MVHLQLAFLSFLLSSSLAQHKLSSDIVGCKDVSCPKDGSDDRCTVGDTTFIGIGLTRISDLPSSLDGLSLVKGVNMSAGSGDPEQDNSPFQSVYYLGTPSRVKEKDLAGCAVVFHDPPAKKFPAPKLPGNTNLTDTRVAHGTCPAVIEQKCIDNLTKRATMAIDNAQGQDICADLRSQLKRDTIDGCADLAGTGHGLGNFTVTSLGDLSPVRNSSDCWPIQPKSDNLAEITQNTVLRNASAEAVYDEAYKITAVLTVFAGKGNSSLVKQTSSQMTCLKLVTNENPGGDKGADKNSATPIYNGLLTTVVATVFAAMLTSM